MKLGQAVIRTPESFIDPTRGKDDPLRRPMKGVVVYIHPQGRYHTVEFELLTGGKIRESFQGVSD